MGIKNSSTVLLIVSAAHMYAAGMSLLSCDVNNGGCGLDLCTTIPTGPSSTRSICECRKGYTYDFSFDKKPGDPTCKDVNECGWSRSCQHGCENTPGSYRCLCPEGQILKADGRTCERDAAPGAYLGCWKDDHLGTRDLPNAILSSPGTMTIDTCITHCGSNGYIYAGLQWAQECFCGNSYGKYGTSPTCDFPCAGDDSTICGGDSRNSIYRV